MFFCFAHCRHILLQNDQMVVVSAFRKIAKSVVMPVSLEQCCSRCMDFREIWWVFFGGGEICRGNSTFHQNRTRITGTSLADLRTFMIISRRIILIIRNVADKYCRENQNTHFVLNNIFRKSCRLWDNVEKYCRPGQATDDSIIRRMRISCWIPKATNTHSEYVMLPPPPYARQQWLHDRTSLISYRYIACLVNLHIVSWSIMNHTDFIYLLTAIGLTPGGSSTVHIYKQYAEHRHETEYTERNVHKNKST
jgi:hypothetical protein